MKKREQLNTSALFFITLVSAISLAPTSAKQISIPYLCAINNLKAFAFVPFMAIL